MKGLLIAFRDNDITTLNKTGKEDIDSFLETLETRREDIPKEIFAFLVERNKKC